MGFLDSVKAWFKTEAAELADTKRGVESRLDTGLSERERRLEETPTEAMERLQSEIDSNESSFEAMEDKIGAAQAKADAVADLAADESAPDDEDILDLPSEEVE